MTDRQERFLKVELSLHGLEIVLSFRTQVIDCPLHQGVHDSCVARGLGRLTRLASIDDPVSDCLLAAKLNLLLEVVNLSRQVLILLLGVQLHERLLTQGL